MQLSTIEISVKSKKFDHQFRKISFVESQDTICIPILNLKIAASKRSAVIGCNICYIRHCQLYTAEVGSLKPSLLRFQSLCRSEFFC